MPTDTNQTIQDSRKAAMSFLESAKNKMKERKERKSTYSRGGGSSRNGSAVDNFLSAGRRNEERAIAAQKGEETGFDLAQRIRNMSDDEFGEALRSGALTTDQVRKAGEYDWDTYMGDVWSETDLPDRFPVEPTYDEFMSDPEKYGYQRGINEETDRAFDRYRRAGAHPVVTKKQ